MTDQFVNELEIHVEQIPEILSLALSKGGDYSDFYYEYRLINSFSLEDGIIKNAGLTIAKGCGIRVLKGDQTGYAYTENLTFESLAKAAKTAAEIADGNNKIIVANIDEKKFESLYKINKIPIDFANAGKIEILKRAESSARNSNSLISKVMVSYMDELKSILVADSAGRMAKDVQPMIMFYVTTIAEKNGVKQRGLSSIGGRLGMECFTEKVTPEQHGKFAANQAITMLDAINSPAGPMEVILASGESGILLHEAVGHPLEADFNRKGTSAYSGRIGEKVASELCTIIDSDRIASNRGSINFGDEGNESKENVLIENGTLRNYMNDIISAKHFNVEPSGNGRRESFKDIPLPRMTCTYMTNGTSSVDDIIKSTKRGVYCKTFSGGQVDISNGDFVFVPSEAYLVENGSIKAPIKNLTLIGNGPDALTKIEMVGNDMKISDGTWTCGKDAQSVPVGVGLPTVKISEMTVGGSDL